jgi:hypothetical protein
MARIKDLNSLYHEIEGTRDLDMILERWPWFDFTQPDVTLCPDGTPYLYRWHDISSKADGNLYIHIQVDDDPERPLHDHPWDNCSLILSGGYNEVYQPFPGITTDHRRALRKGDMVFRRATEAHRLFLPEEFPYSISQFMTGPKYREWGFWGKDGWEHNVNRVTDLDDQGRSFGKGGME